MNREITTGVSFIIIILSIIEIFLHGTSILLYSIPALVLLWYSYAYMSRLSDEDTLDHRRLTWFFSRVADIDPGIQFNIHSIQQFSNDSATLLLQALKAELSINEFQLGVERELPDITEAELEMTKLEERSSIILGSLVVIPVLFALIHLFRSVTLIEFVMELLIAINLGLLVLSTQSTHYSLEEWDWVYSFLFSNRGELIINPRKFMVEASRIGPQYRIQELGIDLDLLSRVPAMNFLHLFISFLAQLVPAHRGQYLDAVLNAIDDLPGKQKLMEQKWQAYTTRLLMIATTSTALGSLFASLTAFRIPLLTAPGFAFDTTPFLVWGEYILLMSLTLVVLQQWFSWSKSIRWIAILTMIYFIFFFFNQILV